MSTIEDFKNAQVGATATHKATGVRAMKMYERERGWILPNGVHLNDEEVEIRGYSLDPLWPAPESAREALDIAWELAHPVKPGQVIPADTRFLEVTGVGMGECIAHVEFEIDPSHVPNIRTFISVVDNDVDTAILHAAGML